MNCRVTVTPLLGVVKSAIERRWNELETLREGSERLLIGLFCRLLGYLQHKSEVGYLLFKWVFPFYATKCKHVLFRSHKHIILVSSDVLGSASWVTECVGGTNTNSLSRLSLSPHCPLTTVSKSLPYYNWIGSLYSLLFSSTLMIGYRPHLRLVIGRLVRHYFQQRQDSHFSAHEQSHTVRSHGAQTQPECNCLCERTHLPASAHAD